MKKKYKILSLIKKIKKNKLSLSLNTLSIEKKKLGKINNDLKEMLDKSKFTEGEVLNSTQLRQTSSFRQNLQEKIEVSTNRENYLENEMRNYLSDINKIKKQREKIEKKIKEEALILEKISELRKNQNFKSKVII